MSFFNFAVATEEPQHWEQTNWQPAKPKQYRLIRPTLQGNADAALLGSKAAALKAEMKKTEDLVNLMLMFDGPMHPGFDEFLERRTKLQEAYWGCTKKLADGRRVDVWAFHAFERGTYVGHAQARAHLGVYNPLTDEIDATEVPPPLPTQEFWPWPAPAPIVVPVSQEVWEALGHDYN